MGIIFCKMVQCSSNAVTPIGNNLDMPMVNRDDGMGSSTPICVVYTSAFCARALRMASCYKENPSPAAGLGRCTELNNCAIDYTKNIDTGSQWLSKSPMATFSKSNNNSAESPYPTDIDAATTANLSSSINLLPNAHAEMMEQVSTASVDHAYSQAYNLPGILNLREDMAFEKNMTFHHFRSEKAHDPTTNALLFRTRSEEDASLVKSSSKEFDVATKEDVTNSPDEKLPRPDRLGFFGNRRRNQRNKRQVTKIQLVINDTKFTIYKMKLSEDGHASEDEWNMRTEEAGQSNDEKDRTLAVAKPRVQMKH